MVEDIINNAIAVADGKSSLADAYARNAQTAASGFVSLNAPLGAYRPPSSAALEPSVHIPANATGVDSALFNSTYGRLFNDLTSELAGFFSAYFPDECDSLQHAQQWICDAIQTGGTGINPTVERQIWERDRDRIEEASARDEDAATRKWASRGFAYPPGMLHDEISRIRANRIVSVAESSRDLAIKTMEMELENVRFAVQQAIDYRKAAVQAAASYISTLASVGGVAANMATAAADAQARLISAASSYYQARIAVAEMGRTAHDNYGARMLQTTTAGGQIFSESISNRTRAAVSLAQSLGSQAAAALNAVHGTAQVVRHVED